MDVVVLERVGNPDRRRDVEPAVALDEDVDLRADGLHDRADAAQRVAQAPLADLEVGRTERVPLQAAEAGLHGPARLLRNSSGDLAGANQPLA